MPFKNSFEGKRVLVTGAGRGFGRALVKRLHSYGAKVFALSRTKETLDTLKKECPGVETICVDLNDWNKTRDALLKLDAMDCLVNNAAYIMVKSAMSATPEEFDGIFNTNVKAVMNICQVVANKMMTAGKSGSIVNISSVAGTKGHPLCAIYAMTKAALQMMSQCLAVELAPKGIRVNVFQPAGMATDLLQGLAAELKNVLGQDGVFEGIMTARTPSGQIIMPIDECLNSVLFLMSDLAPQVVGNTLTIDGGYLCT